MKKICICTTVSLTMKSFVVETAKYLHEKEGYDITLICNDDKTFRESLPEYIHFLPVHMGRGIDFSGFKSILDFIKILEKKNLIWYSTLHPMQLVMLVLQLKFVEYQSDCIASGEFVM